MIALVTYPGWPDDWFGWPVAAAVKVFQPAHEYHCGLLIDGYLYDSSLIGGVARHPESSDRLAERGPARYLDLPWADKRHALEVWARAQDDGYDLLGLADWWVRRASVTLLGREVALGIESPRRWFCSELSAAMLGFDTPIRYSPSKVVRECVKRNSEVLV